MRNKSGIYCILNVANNKKYIGSSICIYSRWQQHRERLNRNKHENRYLQASWNKHSKDSFRFFIIEEIQAKKTSELFEREDYYMKLYNSLNGDYGYNIDLAGCKTSTTERSDREYRPVVILDENGLFVKEFISISEASRELNISIKRLDAVLNHRYNGGKRRFKAKGFIPVYKDCYDKNINYIHKPGRGIKVAKLDLDKNVIDIYDNANDATRKTGLNRANIYEAIYNGNMHKGFYFAQISKDGLIIADAINKHIDTVPKNKIKEIVAENESEKLFFKSTKDALEYFNIPYSKIRYIRWMIRNNKTINGYKLSYK